ATSYGGQSGRRSLDYVWPRVRFAHAVRPCARPRGQGGNARHQTAPTPRPPCPPYMTGLMELAVWDSLYQTTEILTRHCEEAKPTKQSKVRGVNCGLL